MKRREQTKSLMKLEKPSSICQDRNYRTFSASTEYMNDFMHQWGTVFSYNLALFVACGDLLFFFKSLLYLYFNAKGPSVCKCKGDEQLFASSIVFLIWYGFDIGNCDLFKYLLSWVSINTMGLGIWKKTLRVSGTNSMWGDFSSLCYMRNISHFKPA